MLATLHIAEVPRLERGVFLPALSVKTDQIAGHRHQRVGNDGGYPTGRVIGVEIIGEGMLGGRGELIVLIPLDQVNVVTVAAIARVSRQQVRHRHHGDIAHHGQGFEIIQAEVQRDR